MSAFGLFLRKYWKELAALALLSFAAWRGYHWAEGNGVRKERMVWLAKENKALAQAIADNAKANDERRKAEDKLAKALAKNPQTGKKVNDAVTANPTDPKCIVPDDVIAGMQDGIDAGKDSAR